MNNPSTMDHESAFALLSLRQELHQMFAAETARRKDIVEQLRQLDQVQEDMRKRLNALEQVLSVYDVPMEDVIPF